MAEASVKSEVATPRLLLLTRLLKQDRQLMAELKKAEYDSQFEPNSTHDQMEYLRVNMGLLGRIMHKAYVAFTTMDVPGKQLLLTTAAVSALLLMGWSRKVSKRHAKLTADTADNTRKVSRATSDNDQMQTDIKRMQADIKRMKKDIEHIRENVGIDVADPKLLRNKSKKA